MTGFIDIHCHILPGLDDGPPDKETAEEMLKVATKDGISGIVATPHMLNGICNNDRDCISRAIAEIRGIAAGIDIYMGAEIRIGPDLRGRVEKNELPLINDKSFLLLELPEYLIPPVAVLENIVKGLREIKVTPIISHPERNMPISGNIPIMKKLIRCGALFQVTAMSILESRETRNRVYNMIKKNYVHVVASDAHDSRKRPPILSGAFKKIAKEFGEGLARKLFIDNPRRIIRGETVQ